MDRLIRCITKDGAIMASAVDSTNIVYTAQKIHQLTRQPPRLWGGF